MRDFVVVTISKRTGWEERAWEQVAKQTAQPKGWVCIHEDPDQTINYGGWSLYKAPPKTRLSNLNKSLNAGIKRALALKPQYIIFYQDYIDLPKDCFSKLLGEANERTLVTTCTPNYDGSDDSRYLGVDLPRPCRPEEWETNVAIVSASLLKDLGGFEEELDNGWSWDNVHFAQRAAMLGAKFVVDESNRPTLLNHEQTSKLALPLNSQRCADDIQKIRAGQKPVKLNYL